MASPTRQNGLPPGPRWYGLVGGIGFVLWPRRHFAWLRCRYGEIVALRVPHATLVMTLTSDGAHQVLTSDPQEYDAFQKEAFTGVVGERSMWILEGERHHCERRLLSPGFQKQHVRTYGQVIREITRLHTGAWRPGQRIRIHHKMLNISRDFILRIVFGIKDGPLRDEGRRALGGILEVAELFIPYSLAFQGWRYRPWTKFTRAKRHFFQFAESRVEERRAAGCESKDVLGMMLAAQLDDGTRMDNQDILDELISILLAGHETTAIALAWALYELGRHPEILGKLREELGALGNDPDPGVIVQQPYLRAVCCETMRLHTVVTEIARLTKSPRELLGYQIPADVGVGVSICAIHHDPSLFPNPEKFLPERFLKRSYGPFEFLPFGGGHRRCLGAATSDYEMRVVLATIVMEWELEPAGTEREVRRNLTIGPKYGVPMLVKRRRARAVSVAANQ